MQSLISQPWFIATEAVLGLMIVVVMGGIITFRKEIRETREERKQDRDHAIKRAEQMALDKATTQRLEKSLEKHLEDCSEASEKVYRKLDLLSREVSEIRGMMKNEKK